MQKIYFNGRKVADHSFTESKRREDVAQSDPRIDANKVADIFIGGGGVYKSGFNGIIDEVQVWNRPLTDDEVKDDFENGVDQIISCLANSLKISTFAQ